MMSITISISSYNQAEFLPDAVESVLNQTMPYNLIIVEDGSTDNSLAIARKYEEENYNVKVISQVNKGLASARNTGLMNSPNEPYIMFLDADDILLSNCLEKIQETIDKTNADIIAPSFKCFGKGNETIILKENITLEDFKKGNHFPYFCAVKKEVLLKVGGYSPRMIWGYEDLHLWINLLTRGKTVATIKEPLVLYRTKETSMWTESLRHHEELMTQIYKDFPDFK